MRLWLFIGFFGQALFSTRFLIQYIVSEIRKKPVIPAGFWYFSLGGSTCLLSYAIYREDPVFIFGHAVGLFVYARNLMLMYRSRKMSKIAS